MFHLKIIKILKIDDGIEKTIDWYMKNVYLKDK